MSFSLNFLNQLNFFGTQLADPRNADKTTFNWQINVNTTMPFMWPDEEQAITLEIVGVPPVPPIAGDTYELAIIFKRTEVRNPTPLVDAVWVTWIVGNGPKALVSVLDTYSYSGNTIKDLQPGDTYSNDWSVVDWTATEPYTCQKVASNGCDILTARIQRPWH